MRTPQSAEKGSLQQIAECTSSSLSRSVPVRGGRKQFGGLSQFPQDPCSPPVLLARPVCPAGSQRAPRRPRPHLGARPAGNRREVACSEVAQQHKAPSKADQVGRLHLQAWICWLESSHPDPWGCDLVVLSCSGWLLSEFHTDFGFRICGVSVLPSVSWCLRSAWSPPVWR